jgi:hypothetical protein
MADDHFIHKCGYQPGRGIYRKDEYLIEGCFEIKTRPGELQIVLSNPHNPEEDPLYEPIDKCPFCGYQPK